LLILTRLRLRPEDAIQLLDKKYVDSFVRGYAVTCLRQLGDRELIDYLLQLVQALKHEIFYDNPLSLFLLERAFVNRSLVGHYLFWHLRSEAFDMDNYVSHAVLLEAYLSCCGAHKAQILTQIEAVDELQKFAKKVANAGSDGQRKKVMKSTLKTLSLPNPFHLPINPTIVVSSLIPDSCKYMESNTVSKKKKKIPRILFLIFFFSSFRCGLFLIIKHHTLIL